MWMVFLLNFQNFIYVFVDVTRSFDLSPNSLETVNTKNQIRAHRCSHVQHGFPCHECLFMIILNFDVNDVHWSVEITTSGQ
jgi:hypothetical protein